MLFLGSSLYRFLLLMFVIGLVFVDKVFELVVFLEFCIFDEEEDDDLDLIL